MAISEIDMTPAEQIAALRKELEDSREEWSKQYRKARHWQSVAESALAVVKHLLNP